MSKEIEAEGDYACSYCGNVENLSSPTKCNRCEQDTWVKAIQTVRVR